MKQFILLTSLFFIAFSSNAQEKVLELSDSFSHKFLSDNSNIFSHQNELHYGFFDTKERIYKLYKFKE